MAARILPLAVLAFSTYSDADLSDDEVDDSLVEGSQGLGGLAMLGGLLAALFIWLSQRAAYVPMSVLAAMSTGLLVFAGSLAAIYGARLLWPWPALRPRRIDFWVSLALGLLIAAGILAARLAG